MKLGLSTKRGVDYGERTSTLTYLRNTIGTTTIWLLLTYVDREI